MLQHSIRYAYLQSLQLLVERLSHTLQILDVSKHMNLMLSGEHMSRVTATSLALIGKLTKLEKLNVGGQPVDKPMIDAIASGCTVLKVPFCKTDGMRLFVLPGTALNRHETQRRLCQVTRSTLSSTRPIEYRCVPFFNGRVIEDVE